MRGPSSLAKEKQSELEHSIWEWCTENDIDFYPEGAFSRWHWCPKDGSCGCPELIEKIADYYEEKGWTGERLKWVCNVPSEQELIDRKLEDSLWSSTTRLN
jgi:hypothetical protein